MGDPSGVGPEVICKALARLTPQERQDIVILGDIRVLKRANRLIESALAFARVDSFLPTISSQSPFSERINVWHHEVSGAAETRPGEINADGGNAAYEYVCKAVELALAEKIEIMVTAPLNKAAMHLAGHYYDGHTGLLQHLTHTPFSLYALSV